MAEVARKTHNPAEVSSKQTSNLSRGGAVGSSSGS